MNYFAIIALILGVFYQASGQYQWSYVAPPIFYQSPQIYNPFAPVQEFYQTPVFYHTPQQVSRNVVPPQQIPRNFNNQIQNENNLNPETFRGFGYRTNFDDGATSTVVFLSGPQSATQIFKSKSSVTVASDILDPQSSKNIQETLKKTNEDRQGKSLDVPEDPLSRIRAFLENPNLINEGITFFSADGYPANTAPLNKTEGTTQKTTNEEQEPAESVIHHSTINQIPSLKKETTTTTTTTTQESTTLDDITVTTEQELKTVTESSENPTTINPSESTEESTDETTTSQ